MLELLNTTYFLGEEETDGHHPMKFDCSDGNIYYCKYILSVRQSEIDCLAYEILANQLLKSLNISTPDIALVKLTKDSFDKKDIKHNKRIKLGSPVFFGSKMVKASSLVNGTQLLCSKKEINRYTNHSDLIKIAIFDLLVDNRDRGRDDNINLLEAEVLEGSKKKMRFYAIDHAFIFGGINNLRFFRPSDAIDTSNKLVDNLYFRNYIKLVPKKIRLQILEEFITLYNEIYYDTIQNTLPMFHESWNIPQNLNERILNYLSDQNRLNIVKSKISTVLKNP
jgi:hypothetical protein